MRTLFVFGLVLVLGACEQTPPPAPPPISPSPQTTVHLSQPDPEAQLRHPPSEPQPQIQTQPVPRPQQSVSPLVPPPAVPKPADPDDPMACDQPSDCIIHCPAITGCCGWTCGCRNVVNQKRIAAFDRAYAKSCRRSPCPAMDCAYQPAMSATCRNGRCVALNGPAF